jgi:peptidoglycan hydrolase CwlO-like protein
MIHILAALISNSTNINEAIERIKIIKDISNIPKEMLEKMVENIMKNHVLIKSNIFMDELKDLCKNHDISININYIETTIEIDEDNIPF